MLWLIIGGLITLVALGYAWRKYNAQTVQVLDKAADVADKAANAVSQVVK